jgi:hypothetical protein
MLQMRREVGGAEEKNPPPNTIQAGVKCDRRASSAIFLSSPAALPSGERGKSSKVAWPWSLLACPSHSKTKKSIKQEVLTLSAYPSMPYTKGAHANIKSENVGVPAKVTQQIFGKATNLWNLESQT